MIYAVLENNYKVKFFLNGLNIRGDNWLVVIGLFYYRDEVMEQVLNNCLGFSIIPNKNYKIPENEIPTVLDCLLKTQSQWEKSLNFAFFVENLKLLKQGNKPVDIHLLPVVSEEGLGVFANIEKLKSLYLLQEVSLYLSKRIYSTCKCGFVLPTESYYNGTIEEQMKLLMGDLIIKNLQRDKLLAFYYDKTMNRGRYYFELELLLKTRQISSKVLDAGTHISHLVYKAIGQIKQQNILQNIENFTKFVSKVPDLENIYDIDEKLFGKILNVLTSEDYEQLKTLSSMIEFVKYLF